MDEHKSLSLHPTPKWLKMEEEPCGAMSLVPSTSVRPQTLPGAPFMSAGSAPSSLPADTPFPFHPASYFTGKRPLGVEEWKGENGCFTTVHLQPPLIVLQPCNFVLLREEECTQVPGHWMVVKAITIAAAAANVHSPAPTRPAPLKCFTLHVRLTPT